MKKHTRIAIIILIILIIAAIVLFIPFATGSRPSASPLFTIQGKTTIIPAEEINLSAVRIPPQITVYQFAAVDKFGEEPDKLLLPVTIRETNYTAYLIKKDSPENITEYIGCLNGVSGSSVLAALNETQLTGITVRLASESITVQLDETTYLIYSDRENERTSIFGIMTNFILKTLSGNKPVLVSHLYLTPGNTAGAPALSDADLINFPALGSAFASNQREIDVYADASNLPEGAMTETEFQMILALAKDGVVSFENKTYQIQRGVAY